MLSVLIVMFQNGSAGWTDEADSNRGRGEASRDFAKVSLLKSTKSGPKNDMVHRILH